MKNHNQKIFETNMVEKSTRYIDSFRKNIDILIAERNYTLREAAEMADISYDTLKTFLYDKGAKDCRLSTAVKLARAFNISIDEMVNAGTFRPTSLECIKVYRSLPPGSQRFLEWQVRNQKFIHEQQNSSKYVNIMLPLALGNGNMKQTNDYEVMNISHLGDELTYKIFLGIKIPSLNYLPHYTEGDILLIANDRNALRGENTIIMFNDNITITNRYVEHGEEHYYGLMDGKPRAYDPTQLQVVGYVAKILRV